MKIGVSSYSFHQAVEAGTLSTYDIVDTAARMGFASIDFAVLLGDDPLEEMCARLGRQARDAGLDVANYAVAADFLNNDLDAEVARVQGEVENAVRLGARTFRHDGAWGLPKDGSARTFQQALPRIAEGCRRVTEYAAARGDGIDLLIVRGLAVETRGIGLQQGGHLVDKRAGAAGADAVHALFESTFEVDDLGILAAEFDGDIHLRRDALERLRDGDDLLHKGDAERLGKVDRAGAGGAQFERALAERCARLLE